MPTFVKEVNYIKCLDGDGNVYENVYEGIRKHTFTAI